MLTTLFFLSPEGFEGFETVRHGEPEILSPASDL